MRGSEPLASAVGGGEGAVGSDKTFWEIPGYEPLQPSFSRHRSLLCGLGAGGVFQDGPKTPNRPKWPSRLDGTHIFKHMCVCSVLQFSAIRGDWRSHGVSSPT